MVARSATPASTPHGFTFAPVKIGVLIDMDMGTKDDFLAALRFAFDEALETKVITRGVELVVKEAIGLPRLRRALRPRDPARVVHDADPRRPGGDTPQDPRSAPRLPRLPRLRLPDHPHGADVHASRLGPAAYHDHRVSVLLRQARMDGGT